MYKIDLIATWTSPQKGISLFICKFPETKGARFNKIRILFLFQSLYWLQDHL